MIKTITEDDINKAFDNLEKAFCDLAKIEDKQNKLAEDLPALKGSRKGDQIEKKLHGIQLEMVAAQRAYRLAGMRADRVRLLLDVAKTAMGRD